MKSILNFVLSGFFVLISGMSYGDSLICKMGYYRVGHNLPAVQITEKKISPEPYDGNSELTTSCQELH